MVDRSSDIRVDNSHGVQIGPGGHQQNTWQIILNPKIALAAIAVIAVLGAAVVWSIQRGRGADVRLAAVSLGHPGAVDTVDFETETADDGTERRTNLGPGSISATPIDITLKNDGAASAVVLEASVTVVFAGLLEDCVQSGGPLEVEANYDVRLPRNPPAVPFTVNRSMRFEVEPHASERFTLTVGPQTQGVGSWDGRVYVADVSLKLDYSSKPLSVGRAGWVTRPGNGYDNLRMGLGKDPGCLTKNSATVARFAAAGGKRSDEAATLVRLYSHLTAPDGGMYEPSCMYRGSHESRVAIADTCAVYTKDVFVASIGISQRDAAGRNRLLVRLTTTDGAVRHVVHCVLEESDERHEAVLEPPGTWPAAVDPCGGYDRDYGDVWLYAFPAADLVDDEMMVTAQLVGAGEVPDINVPPTDVSAIVFARRMA